MKFNLNNLWMPMVSQIYLKWKFNLPFSDGICSILRLSVSQANPILSPVSNGQFTDTSFRLVSCSDIYLSTKRVLKAPFPPQASTQEMSSKEHTNCMEIQNGLGGLAGEHSECSWGGGTGKFKGKEHLSRAVKSGEAHGEEKLQRDNKDGEMHSEEKHQRRDKSFSVLPAPNNDTEASC